MYATDGMELFKVYWKDMNGNKHYYFDEGDSKKEVLDDAEKNVKGMYMASFSIVGLEQKVDGKWIKINTPAKYCKGR